MYKRQGQGTALNNGLKFIVNWEKPTSYVLDYFQLDHVSLMGISWGGYFVMRAAAYEKRIEKVIAFDIFYSALDALTTVSYTHLDVYKRQG